MSSKLFQEPKAPPHNPNVKLVERYFDSFISDSEWEEYFDKTVNSEEVHS